jgi:hypothetical protein
MLRREERLRSISSYSVERGMPRSVAAQLGTVCKASSCGQNYIVRYM